MTLILKGVFCIFVWQGFPRLYAYVKIQQTVHLGLKHFMHFTECALTSIKKKKKKSIKKDMAA